MQLISQVLLPEAPSAWQIRSTMSIGDRTFTQLQLLDEEYVVTEIGDQILVFFRDDGQRYLAQAATRSLHPVELPAQLQPGAASDVPPRLTSSPERVTVMGFECRRITVEAEIAGALLTSDAFYARFAGVERTSLHMERVLHTPAGYPAHLLDPSEVLISSTTRVQWRGAVQRQSCRAESVETPAHPTDRLLEVLEYPRISG